MLEFLFGAALIAGLIPYVVGPFVVRFTQKAPADPVFEPYDATRHAFPAELSELLRRTAARLESDGFRPVAQLFHSSDVTNSAMRLVLLGDPARGEYPLAAAAASTNPKVRLAFTYAECYARLADQRTLSVQNSPQIDVFGAHPRRLVYRFPQVRDPVRLVRAYRGLLERRYAGVPRDHVDPGRDPGGFLAAAMRRELDYQVEAGRLWLDESERVYRPTWRGAFAMTWAVLPPMSWIREWRARRRAARLLDELGLTGPDPAPVHNPPLPDPLKWSFFLLVAATVLGWLAFR